MSYQQNVGQNHNIKKANKSFGNVAKLKYLGMALTYKNWQDKKWEQIKSGKCLLPFYLECLCFLICCLKTSFPQYVKHDSDLYFKWY